MPEGAPNNFYDEVPQTEMGAIGDGSGHEAEFIDLSEPTAETTSAWQGTVDRVPGVPVAGDVMVGENLVRPSTAGRSADHIDLPIGEEMPGRSATYDKMVGGNSEEQQVDLELP